MWLVLVIGQKVGAINIVSFLWRAGYRCQMGGVRCKVCSSWWGNVIPVLTVLQFQQKFVEEMNSCNQNTPFIRQEIEMPARLPVSSLQRIGGEGRGEGGGGKGRRGETPVICPARAKLSPESEGA